MVETTNLVFYNLPFAYYQFELRRFLQVTGLIQLIMEGKTRK